MSRIHTKSIVVLLIAGGLTVAAFAQNKDNNKRRNDRKPENLKVLPKNIGHDSLIAIMKNWEGSLGVNCGYCHAKSKTQEGRLDFASDENKKKDVARGMYKMTASINKEYFKWWDPKKESHPSAVSCYTCHHGNKEPEAFTPPAEDERGDHK